MKRLALFHLIWITIAFYTNHNLFAELNHCIDFSIDDLVISEYEEYDVINLAGCHSSTEIIGAPDLPGKIVNFLIPQDKTVKAVNLLNHEKIKVLGSYTVLPKQLPIPVGGDPPPFIESDPWYYETHLQYPAIQYEIIQEGFRSEYRIVTLRIYPLVYDPLETSLWLSTHIDLSIELAEDCYWGIPVKRRSEVSQRRIEKVIKSMVINSEDVEEYASSRIIESGKTNMERLYLSDMPSMQGKCIDYIIRFFSQRVGKRDSLNANKFSINTWLKRGL
jgi:hypothetical protein